MKLNLILGAGISGISIAKLLLEKGEAVLIADDNLQNTPKELLGYQQCIVYKRGLHLDLAQLQYDKVIKSPGLPNTHPLVEALSEKYFMYSDIEIGYQYSNKNTFIGITGSNGKTTVTSLVKHLCQDDVVVAGNIGIPIGDVILNHSNTNVVLELSSFQCEGIKTFKPAIAAILNLSPDHLDRYYSVEQYYQAKLQLLKNMDKDDIFIRNQDDIKLMKMTKDIDLNIIDFSLAHNPDLHLKGPMVFYKDTYLFDSRSLKMVGRHNLANAMVAAMIAYLLKIDLELIQQRLADFKGVEHRIEFVDEINGIKYYNDSKATNPEATQVALESFSNNIHLLVGGYDKKISFDLLKMYQDKLKSVQTFGQTGKTLSELFSNATKHETLTQALFEAIKVAEEGDIILLSPACASYDQFKNYEQRGQHFKQLVHELGNV